MRPFPTLAAVVTAAFITATLVDPENWLRDKVPLVVVAYLATMFVTFSWCELWSTRHDR